MALTAIRSEWEWSVVDSGSLTRLVRHRTSQALHSANRHTKERGQDVEVSVRLEV